MTDKVQKIREEVKKLKSQLLRGACSSQIAMETHCKEEAYNEVLTLLDTMLDDTLSKETKKSWNERLDKKDFRERYKRIAQSESFKKAYEGISIGDAIPVEGEESVSEDLEKASKEWLAPQLDKSYAAYGETKQMELTHFDGYAMLDAIEFGVKWQKAKDESTTEDLGDYINKLSKQFPEVSFAKLSRIAVRVAKWHKEQFEKNRLKHCNSITNEQAELEQCFIDQHLDKHQRMPTFLDAIEYGMRLQKEQIEEALLSEVLPCFMHGGEADEVVAKLEEVLDKK